jgi:hypothetical protein
MERDGKVIRALIGRPLALPPALVDRFPELAGVRWRRGGLPVRVAGLFLGRSPVAAITLWRTVFLAPYARLDAELLLHELRHVHQFQASPAFPLLYLWESLFRGYHRNRFEADARAYAARRAGRSSASHA